ncbi:hypothetical protein MKEN_00439400 [Mycena kentingensis (nom. inval.)]|nr:hypothetical protein MKEN_00439400 [Mycena kentingensis (nom. inval.)]
MDESHKSEQRVEVAVQAQEQEATLPDNGSVVSPPINGMHKLERKSTRGIIEEVIKAMQTPTLRPHATIMAGPDPQKRGTLVLNYLPDPRALLMICSVLTDALTFQIGKWLLFHQQSTSEALSELATMSTTAAPTSPAHVCINMHQPDPLHAPFHIIYDNGKNSTEQFLSVQAALSNGQIVPIAARDETAFIYSQMGYFRIPRPSAHGPSRFTRRKTSKAAEEAACYAHLLSAFEQDLLCDQRQLAMQCAQSETASEDGEDADVEDNEESGYDSGFEFDVKRRPFLCQPRKVVWMEHDKENRAESEAPRGCLPPRCTERVRQWKKSQELLLFNKTPLGASNL